MPEGDTVYRTARRLDEALAGAEVTRFELRVPQAATVDLRGVIVHEVVVARQAPAAPHRRVDAALPPQDGGRVARLPAGRAVAQARASRRARSSARRVGDRRLRPRRHRGRPDRATRSGSSATSAPTRWPRTGIPAEAARRLARRRPRPVHVAIQDQRNVAGFGNEYANEILFVRGILPTTPANETDAAALVDLGARMIRANRDRADRTFTGDARPGPHDLGLRAGGPALPALRHPHPRRFARRRPDPRAHRLLVPACQTRQRVARVSPKSSAEFLPSHPSGRSVGLGVDAPANRPVRPCVALHAAHGRDIEYPDIPPTVRRRAAREQEGPTT